MSTNSTPSNEAPQKKIKSWKSTNEHNKVWRLDDSEYKPWGLAWELIPTPRIGTVSCRDYFTTWSQINSFMAYVFRTAGTLHRLSEILGTTPIDKADAGATHGGDRKRMGILQQLSVQRQNFSEILLSRHVDNFLTYLSSVLFESFIENPFLLKSNEKIDIKTILDQPTVEDIVRVIAEKKVESLAYSSFSDLSSYIHDKLSIAIADSSDYHAIVESIEDRNIIVHNRCTINSRYALRTKCDLEMIGLKRQLDISDIERKSMLLGYTAKSFDARLRRKIRIPTVRFRIDPFNTIKQSDPEHDL